MKDVEEIRRARKTSAARRYRALITEHAPNQNSADPRFKPHRSSVLAVLQDIHDDTPETAPVLGLFQNGHPPPGG